MHNEVASGAANVADQPFGGSMYRLGPCLGRKNFGSALAAVNDVYVSMWRCELCQQNTFRLCPRPVPECVRS